MSGSKLHDNSEKEKEESMYYPSNKNETRLRVISLITTPLSCTPKQPSLHPQEWQSHSQWELSDSLWHQPIYCLMPWFRRCIPVFKWGKMDPSAHGLCHPSNQSQGSDPYYRRPFMPLPEAYGATAFDGLKPIWFKSTSEVPLQTSESYHKAE